MTKDTSDPIEAAILELVEKRGPGKSICPSEAARAVYPADWRGRMRQVRSAAVHLARHGDITILRKGKPVDPDDFRGVYRLGPGPKPQTGDDDA
jgi:hypothetical protein